MWISIARLSMSRDLQMPQLRIAHAGGVQHHQHRALRQRPCRRDQTLDLLQGEHRRQPPRDLRVGRVVEEIAPPQRLHEEETERADLQLGPCAGAASAPAAGTSDTPDVLSG